MHYGPPDPVELRGSRAADEEVDGKQVPVLGDNDQRVSGPDKPWWRRTTATSEGYAHGCSAEQSLCFGKR